MSIYYRPQAPGNLATTGTSETLGFLPESTTVGLVVDVILSHTSDSKGKEGYNIGLAKIRVFSDNRGASDDTLPYIPPLETSIKQFPLIGELVLVHKTNMGKYYSRHLGIARRVTENAMIKINDRLTENTLQQLLTAGVEVLTEKHKFGKYFKPDSRVRPLMHAEGDTIIEGRMGHSIRFGSSILDPSTDGLAPNIIIRTGQAKGAEEGPVSDKSPFGVIVEDINKDAASIWMVADQKIPFNPATKTAGSFVRSVATAPQEFDKAQIIINSDRLVLNSKGTHIMLFANEGIHLNSFKDTTIDTDSNIIFTANQEINLRSNGNIESTTDQDFTITAASDVLSLAMEKTSFISKKIYLGTSQNDTEPMVGGTSLSKFLARLIHALVNGQAETPPLVFTPGGNKSTHVIGAQGAASLAPGVVAALSKLYAELVPQNPGQENNKTDFAGAPFNSQANFVMLQNEEPEIVKNEFKEGTQQSVDLNKWVLSDTYYRVT